MTNSPDQPRTGVVTCLYAILAKLNEPNLGDRHFFEWLDCASIDYLKGANAEIVALRTRLEEAEQDSKRLDDLERKAEGYPIEVDAFMSCEPPAVFLTIHPADHSKPAVNGVLESMSVRLAQGHSLREAIDALSTPSKEQVKP